LEERTHAAENSLRKVFDARETPRRLLVLGIRGREQFQDQAGPCGSAKAAASGAELFGCCNVLKIVELQPELTWTAEIAELQSVLLEAEPMYTRASYRNKER